MAECVTCRKETEGFKCDVCGTESATHDDKHKCGGDHCVPKCRGCGEAETKCICV